MSGRPHLPSRVRRTVARAVAATAVLATALAFAQPTWVADPDGAYPGRQAGVQGLAYVEAATFPADLTQDQTGLFVVCDGASLDATDLFLWVGVLPPGAVDAAGTLEVLTRRGSDAARSARWSVDVDSVVGEVVVANPTVRSLLLEDLRRGGTLAVRLATDPAAGAAQPTFVYEVDGFPEDALDCGSRTVAASDPFAGAPIVPVEPAADDPFADAPVAPVDPFADATAAPEDPFADAPRAPDPAPPPAADPFAVAPVAPASTAPPAVGDGYEDAFLTDPTTGLLSLSGTLAEVVSIPPRVDLTALTTDAAGAIIYANPGGVISAFGGFCDPEGGGDNGFFIELASPAFATFEERGTLVLYADGYEIGFVELGIYVDDRGATAYVVYDQDELGILRALEAFPTLEAVVFGSGAGDRADAYWGFATAEIATAVAVLDCAP